MSLAKKMMSLRRIAESALMALVLSSFLQGCEVVDEIKSSIEATTTTTPIGEVRTGLGSETKLAGAQPTSVAKSKPTSFRSMSQGIPLHVGSWFGGPRLVIEVAPSSLQGGWLPKQRLVLDSGSSTLAFCDSQFRQNAQYEASTLISCNLYNPGGDFTGYFGPFVKGPVKVGNITMPDAAYSIMQQESSMPCTDGLDGIFGIAFRQLDQAFESADESFMEITQEGKFTCPQRLAGVVPPPLVEHLKSEDSKMLGIYWSGQQGESEGKLFLGSSAVENEHYALANPLPAATLGELGWYDIQVEAIDVNEQQITGLQCDPTQGHTCILDTGTPAIVLPPEAYDLVQSEQEGTLSFQLAGPDGAGPSLRFNLQQLNEMGAISKGGKGDGLILGLPIWAFYYTVFDLQAKQVIFVPTYPQPSQPAVYPTEGPVWQPEPIEPTEPVIPFPGDGEWRPIPGGAGDIVGPLGPMGGMPMGMPMGLPMGLKEQENLTEAGRNTTGAGRRLRGSVLI